MKRDDLVKRELSHVLKDLTNQSRWQRVRF